MSKILYISKFTRKMVRENSSVYFVFGDNLERTGTKGQAIIRGLPNTIGVPTKKSPSMHPRAFFTDSELAANKLVIDKAFREIKSKLKQGYYIALPKNGLGTGLAKLEEKAPETNKHLLKRLKQLISQN